MDDSNSMFDKTMDSTGPGEKVRCECVNVCICESKNGTPGAPVPDDDCGSGSDDDCDLVHLYASKRVITNECNSSSSICSNSIDNSNVLTDKSISLTGLPKIPCETSKGALSDSDPDGCHVCALKKDRSSAHNSCKWGLAVDGVTAWASEDLDSYVFASRLFDHCCSILKVKNKGRVQDLIIENYDKALEIYLKLCSTDRSLEKGDFIEISNMLTTFKEKGLVTDSIFSNFKRAVKENGYILSEIDELSSNITQMNIQDYHQTPDALKYFNNVANKFYSNSYKWMVDELKTEDNLDKYPDLIFAKFMEPIDKGDANQSRINLLKSLNFLVVMCDIQFLHNKGWLCKCDLSKYIEVDRLASDLITEKAVIAKQRKYFLPRIVDGLRIAPNGEISYDVESRELPMEDVNWELIGQRICITGRRGHNKPLCEMCGVQSSWLKTFKKRGIRIKEADNCNKQHIWYNDKR